MVWGVKSFMLRRFRLRVLLRFCILVRWETKIVPQIKSMIKEAIDASTRELEHGSLYTGDCGLAAVMLLISESKVEMDIKLEDALKLCEASDKIISSRRVTFIEGSSGAQALMAVINHKLEIEANRDLSVFQCLQIAHRASRLDRKECEVLYGRAGYLYSILYLRAALNNPKIGIGKVDKIVKQIVKEGIKGSKNNPEKGFPLYFEWHQKCYLGAAHGLAGIFKILLHFPEEMKKLKADGKLKEGIDHLLSLKFPSGNMPSSYGKYRDVCVHWCHGAAGFVPLCLLAHKVYADEGYLKHAKLFGDVVWIRGLLAEKAHGLCHSAAGNAMAFLSLYRHTGDELWLRRAQYFARYVLKNFGKLAEKTDKPHSLFTGVLGAALFFIGVLKPESSFFIGFETPPVKKQS
ncbi:hypothetical protein AAMO2058_000847700 [Amorphochlora amoebiformis]